MTKKIFTKGMSMFLATFQNIKANKANHDIWYELLSDITDEQFIYAIKKICLEVRDWYPTTNFVAVVREQFTVDIETTALLAWETVVKTMRETGAYISVEFDDPVIHSVILIMAENWSEFCHIPCEKWMQKDFINNYRIMVKKEIHPKYLKGIYEIENTENGYLEHVKPPKQIEINTHTKLIKELK